MKNDLLKFEQELYDKNIILIAGVDEAGRGPLCGPVVAGACILPKNYHLEGLNDSKQLSEKKREEYFEILKSDAIAYGVGIVNAKEIDEINILEASRKAMYLAISNLKVKPEYVLSDAMKLDDLDIPYESIIHGDALSLSIAAASVIAKVTRDHIMYEIDKEHPEYNIKKHKGYPTKEHLQLIKKYGIFEEYRKSYKPVREILGEMEHHEKNKKVVAS
ncbi:MAG: ribonuclease HII [Firmicutes bacterium]|nr:ribonuclease HII [Bacillota bacterium]